MQPIIKLKVSVHKLRKLQTMRSIRIIKRKKPWVEKVAIRRGHPVLKMRAEIICRAICIQLR